MLPVKAPILGDQRLKQKQNITIYESFHYNLHEYLIFNDSVKIIITKFQLMRIGLYM